MTKGKFPFVKICVCKQFVVPDSILFIYLSGFDSEFIMYACTAHRC